MYRYLILDVLFVAIAAAVVVSLRRHWRWKVDLQGLLVLLLLTTVFDSVMIAAGLIVYHTGRILGMYVGKAPLEDFAYPLVAALVLPCLWRMLRSKHER